MPGPAQTPEPTQTRRPQTPADLNRILTVIWVSFLWSCAIFVGVTVKVLVKNPVSSSYFPNLTQPNELILTGVALSSFILSFLIPHLILSRAAALRLRPDAEKEIRGKYFVAKLVSFVIAECTTIVGILVTLAAQSDRVILSFFMLSAISLLANRPSENEIMSLLRQNAIQPPASS